MDDTMVVVFNSEVVNPRLEKYRGRIDCGDLQVEIFQDGGEALLREFSDLAFRPERRIGDNRDGAYLRRLEQCLTEVFLTGDEFKRYAANLPTCLLPALARNEYCPEDVLESIWIGDYYDCRGESEPDAVSSVAFFRNFEKAISICARRPDLRMHIDPCMRKLYEKGLRAKGYAPSGESLEESLFKMLGE